MNTYVKTLLCFFRLSVFGFVIVAQTAMAYQLNQYEQQQVQEVLDAYNQRYYLTAFEKVSPLAKKGNAWAQFMLGHLYEKGLGVDKNDKDAVYWYRKAAEQGEAYAQDNLGWIYANGHGVKQDDKEAVYWYRKAAEQGSANAQGNLGRIYANGHGVKQDDKEAVYWYRKAAEQGDAVAQNNLGLMYEAGRGVQRNDKEAVYWYRKAAEQGYVNAQEALGWMYANGRGVTQDDKEAVYWYRKAAEQGETVAQFNLGLMYANGRGVTQDDKEAVYWYRKAAAQGYVNAQEALGWMYANGRGVTQDDKEAVYWYRKAAEQGETVAQFNLGLMYANGHGVAKDYKEAAHWLTKAAENGNARAQNSLGWHYYKAELGLKQDFKQALYWYEKSAEQGDSYAMANIGRLYEEGKGVKQNYKLAVQWYEKAADAGMADVPMYEEQYKLAKLYEQGLGTKKDLKKAAYWFEIAKKHGYGGEDDIQALLTKTPAADVNKKRWLFVIGIEAYDKTDSILYSRKSAETFSEVAAHILGIHPSRHVLLLDNQATSGAIQDELRLMLGKVKEGDEVYFYYSGHGLPVPEEGNAAYILPSDKIPDFIASDTFYKTESIYRMLENSRAGSVVAFMDSCFTGQMDGKSVFQGEKAATRLQPKKTTFPKNGKVAVITAGTDKQFSNAYKEKGHRLFSYFLMRSMLEGKYKNVGQLAERVRVEVSDKSLDLGGMNQQTPVFTGNPMLGL